MIIYCTYLYIYVTQTLLKSEWVSLLARRYQDFALWAPASRFLAWVSTEDWTPNSSTLCRCQISTNLSEVLLLGHINEVFCVLNSGWERSQAQRISSTGDLSLLGTRSFAACQEWVKLLVSSTVGVLWVSKWALIDLDIAYIIVKDVLVLAGPTCNVFLIFFTLSLSLAPSLFMAEYSMHKHETILAFTLQTCSALQTFPGNRCRPERLWS